MRRNDTGFVGTLTDDVSEDVSFRRDIQCRGGFIEKQHRSITENGAGDSKPLGLTFGETATTFPDTAVDGIRQMLNKIPGAGDFECLNDLLVGRILFYHAHIFGDCAGKDRISLWNIGEEMTRFGVHGNRFSV